MVGSERDDDAGGAATYRPVSVPAVAAAAVGVASSLALLTPMLWVLPLVGIGLAITALADVARPGAEKAGRMLALCGLALSVGFGAQAVTSSIVARRIVGTRAMATVNAWVDAIREGRLADARSMADGALRGGGMPSRPGREPGQDDAARQEAAFLALPAVVAISGCGPAAPRDVRFTGPDAANPDTWGATMRLAPCLDGKSVVIALQLVPSMVRDEGGQVERWTIVKADVVP